MEKLLIHLAVPAVGRDFDVLIPPDISVRRVIRTVVTGIAETTNGRYRSSGTELLTAEDGEAAFSPDRTLDEYGVRDGDKLVLI